jgi:hypothetical protein
MRSRKGGGKHEAGLNVDVSPTKARMSTPMPMKTLKDKRIEFDIMISLETKKAVLTTAGSARIRWT